MMKAERPDIRESTTLARCLAHCFAQLYSHLHLATFVLASSHLLDSGNILWMVVPVYSRFTRRTFVFDVRLSSFFPFTEGANGLGKTTCIASL